MTCHGSKLTNSQGKQEFEISTRTCSGCAHRKCSKTVCKLSLLEGVKTINDWSHKFFPSTLSEGHSETKLTVSLRPDIQCLVLTYIYHSTYISAHILHMFSFTLLHIVKDTFQLGVHECTLVSLFPLLQLIRQIELVNTKRD